MALTFDDLKGVAQGMAPQQAMQIAQIAQMATQDLMREGKDPSGEPSTSDGAFVPYQQSEPMTPFPTADAARRTLLSGASRAYLFAGPFAHATKCQALSGAALTLGASTAAPTYDSTTGYTFDGVDDFATIGPAPALTPAFTISLLVKRLAVTDSQDKATWGVMKGDAGFTAFLSRDRDMQLINAANSTLQGNIAPDSAVGNGLKISTGWMVETVTFDGRYACRYWGSRLVTRLDMGAKVALRDSITVDNLMFLGAIKPSGTVLQHNNVAIAGLMAYEGVAYTQEQVNTLVEAWYAATDVSAAAGAMSAPYQSGAARNGGSATDFYGISPIYLTATAWPENEHTQLRKAFTVAKLPGSYEIEVGGSGNHRVFVNGSLVLGSNPRQASLNLRPVRVDIASALRVGTNVLVIENYQRGRFARTSNSDYKMAHQWRTNAGVFVRDFIGTLGLSTNTSWKVRVDPAYAAHTVMMCDSSATPAVGGSLTRVDAYQYVHPQVINMALIEDVHAATYSDAAWPAAVLTTMPNWSIGYAADDILRLTETKTASWSLRAYGSIASPAESAYVAFSPCGAGQRYQGSTLARSDGDIQPPTKLGGVLSMRGHPTKDQYVTLDLGEWRYGCTELAITSDAALRLEVMDSCDGPDANGKIRPLQRGAGGSGDIINLAIGARTVRLGFAGTAPRGGRYFAFVLRAGVGNVTITPSVSQWSLVDASAPSITTSDPTLQFIWRAAGNALVGNMHDGSVDNTRRDAGCWQKSHTQAPLMWLKGDVSIHRKMLQESADGMMRNTSFPVVADVVPGTHLDAGRYDWSWSLVDDIYGDFMWTGDRAYARRFIDVMRRMFDGLVGPGSVAFAGQTLPYKWNSSLPMSQVYGDFRALEGSPSNATPASSDWVNYLIQHAWLARALERAAFVATAVGDVKKGAEWLTLARKTKAVIASWRVAAAGAIPAHPVYPIAAEIGMKTDFSVAGVMSAIEVGAVDAPDLPALLDYLCPEDGTLPALGPNACDWSMPGYYHEWPRTARALGRNPWPLMKAWMADKVPHGFFPETRHMGGFADTDFSTSLRTNSTRCHNWNAAALAGFVEGCLGARINTPGGPASFNPVPGLPDLSVRLHTPTGPVQVDSKSGVVTVFSIK